MNEHTPKIGWRRRKIGINREKRPQTTFESCIEFGFEVARAQAAREFPDLFSLASVLHIIADSQVSQRQLTTLDCT